MQAMNGRIVSGLTITGVLGWVGFGIGWALVAGFLPATPPTDSAQQIAEFYLQDLMPIRVGLMIGMFCLTFVYMWGVGVFLLSRRIEGGWTPFSFVQLAAMTAANGFTLLCVICWMAASYRVGEISPEITLTLHDFGWLMFELSWPPYFVWLIAIAIVILRDRSANPLLPRWVAYLTIAEAIVNFLDSFLHIFKTGPLAYDGFYALWVTVWVFWAWALVLSVMVIRAARRPDLSWTAGDTVIPDGPVRQPTPS
jgi:hypothetical protein